MTISVDSMLTSVRQGATNPLGAGSIFKNPAAGGLGQLNIVQSNLSALSVLPGVNPSIATAANSAKGAISSYSGAMQSNISSRLSTIPRDLAIVSAADRNKAATAAVDGTGYSPCSLVNDIFNSIHKAEEIVNDVITSIQDTIAGILGIVGDLFNAGLSFVISVINAAEAAITSAFTALNNAVTSALNTLNDMIASELDKLSKLVDELFDFSFLKNLITLDPCSQSVADSVIDTSKVDYGKIASL